MKVFKEEVTLFQDNSINIRIFLPWQESPSPLWGPYCSISPNLDDENNLTPPAGKDRPQARTHNEEETCSFSGCSRPGLRALLLRQWLCNERLLSLMRGPHLVLRSSGMFFLLSGGLFSPVRCWILLSDFTTKTTWVLCWWARLPPESFHPSR